MSEACFRYLPRRLDTAASQLQWFSAKDWPEIFGQPNLRSVGCSRGAEVFPNKQGQGIRPLSLCFLLVSPLFAACFAGREFFFLRKLFLPQLGQTGAQPRSRFSLCAGGALRSEQESRSRADPRRPSENARGSPRATPQSLFSGNTVVPAARSGSHCH